MRKLLTAIALAMFIMNGVHAGEKTETLVIEMSDPGMRISIPGMPEIEMIVHPMHEQYPYFRLRGEAGTTSISIITPKIDAEVSPMTCASAIANVILAQQDVTREQVFLGRANEQTFLIIYGQPVENSVLLNTHIVSSHEATQCIEAHVSKISTSDTDIEPWFNGFGESNIEKL